MNKTVNNADKKKLIIFDTTLRDGEQSPGASMNKDEKLRIALKLECLKVDVIEAGFPASSPGDFEAVKMIAETIKKCQVAGLCRATKADIDRAWEALKNAVNPRIHTFIATSDIHLKYKLKISRKEALKRAVAAVKHAKSYTDNVEFSAEDGSRTDPEYLCKVFAAVIKAGATTVNLPDTVGYADPDEFFELIKYVIANTEGIENAVLSVHCHNDRGLATANTTKAIKAGATQVEVTMNGIGERAGNTGLEEVVMGIVSRPDLFPVYTDIDTKCIMSTSKTVSNITGMLVQPNKSIVGANAFSHESGIHQDGMLKNPMTYQVINPEDIGLNSSHITLGKLSGKTAIVAQLKKIGFNLDEEQFALFMVEYKKLADKKREITNSDLDALAIDLIRGHEKYSLEYIQVSCGSSVHPVANAHVSIDGVTHHGAMEGAGPVDATFNTIAEITGIKPNLIEYRVGSITGGTDAQGNVSVEVEYNGLTVSGRGSDADIITASAKAYINALNRLIYRKTNPLPNGTEPVEVL